MKILLLLFLLPALGFSAQKKWTYPESPKLDDEFTNVYAGITNSTNGPAVMAPPSFTLSNLKLFTPPQAGLFYFCSDCATDAVCVSTGTTKFGIARLTSRTTQCQ